MKIFINYADKYFYNSQKEGCESALKNGFDEVIAYNRSYIDLDFQKKYHNILDLPRGAGYWLWKPYIIIKTLEKINYGDYLFYCDAGANLIEDIKFLIDELKKTKQEIMPFDLQQLIEKKFTKRDVFIYNQCDVPSITDTNICDAAFQLIIKSSWTFGFYSELLRQACIENLITDCPNIYGLPNYPEFIDHRHDQSIYSVNVKKNKLIIFRTPSQYGIGFEKYYKYSDYPQIINHHRRK